MGYRNKTYVCFDADSDIHNYNLMKAWKQNDKTKFNFHDAHDLNNIWGKSSEETIKRKLRERMASTKVLVVLVGEKTKYLYKYVRWEIEIALKDEIPIIIVNLNQKTSKDSNLCPPILKDELAIHINFSPKSLQYTLEKWPTYHKRYKKENKISSYSWKNSVYKELNK